MKHLRVALLPLLGASLLFGAGRRQLFEVDLSKFVGGQADLAAYVWGIRFSPDETKMAIGFSPRWDRDPRGQRVVVVAVGHAETALRQFKLNSFSEDGIAWSPSGSMLVVDARPTPVILRLDSTAACELPEDSGFRGFLSGDRMVVITHHYYGTMHIQIHAPDCALLNNWATDDLVFGTAPGRDLLAVQKDLGGAPGFQKSVIELMDVSSHVIKQHWSSDTLWGLYGFVLANQEKDICASTAPQNQNRPRPACWNIDTGAQVAENHKVSLWLGGILGSGGDLLAMTDYRIIPFQGKFWDFLDMAGYHVSPKRRVIWNIRTGQEVAAWSKGLEQQQLQGLKLSNAKEQSVQSELSISQTGKYVAEGGSGKVTVYALNP